MIKQGKLEKIPEISPKNPKNLLARFDRGG